MPILLAIAAIIGFFIGTKAVLLVQLAVIVIGALYLKSESVRRMEIAALIPMGLYFCLIIGLVVGDIVFYTVHPVPLTDVSFFKWLFSV